MYGGDGYRGAAEGGGAAVEVADAVFEAVFGVGSPFVAVVEDAVEDARAFAADDDRRVGALGGLGPGPERAEADEVAVVCGFVLGPDGAHGEDVLAQAAEAGGGVDAVVVQLLAVPARADAEEEAPAGDEVEGGDLLGEGDRVVLGDEADAGAEAEGGGGAGDGGEGDEGVEEARQPGVGMGAAGVDGGPGDGQVGVLGEEEGFEAERFDQAAEGDDVHGLVGGLDVDAEVHGLTLPGAGVAVVGEVYACK
ncbi:MAG: hypothetical protein U0232_18175 [Thermomicrobiales bacterium]